MAESIVSKAKVIQELVKLKNWLGRKSDKDSVQQIIDRIDVIAGIDAVKVVRCSECRHSLPNKYAEGLMHCCYTRKQTLPCGFCHMGMRREEVEADG